MECIGNGLAAFMMTLLAIVTIGGSVVWIREKVKGCDAWWPWNVADHIENRGGSGFDQILVLLGGVFAMVIFILLPGALIFCLLIKLFCMYGTGMCE